MLGLQVYATMSNSEIHISKAAASHTHTHTSTMYILLSTSIRRQETLGRSLLFGGWSPWIQTVPARVLLKLLEEELPLEVPQVLQDLRRQRLS